MNIIGYRLKQVRERHNLNQVEFANKLGLTKSTVNRYESNEIIPSIKTLIEIRKTFNVSIDWLLGFDTDIPKEYNEVMNKCIDNNISPNKLLKIIDVLQS
ncbi:MAG TPA: helix-turn-helix transcriptional regulator [Epulopiscium sp.]|nr:helix-turn-helix transcriptional regulator [Candidatus Epulonipiscium sp.]